MKARDQLINCALLLAGLVAWCLGCAPPRASLNKTEPSGRPAPASQSPGGPAASGNWRYSESADKMGRGTIKTATTTSLNTVTFDFPYAGAQNAELTLRTHPQHGKDVILSIERGQFLTGVDGCKVLVRFDEATPQTYWANGPADHGTTMIFIDGYAKFVAALKIADRVRVEAPFYREGNQVFEFDVSGLEWEASAQKKKAK